MEALYKLLIADDEYWIREQLRSLVDWENYGIEFLEPAVDGGDAFEKIKSEKPDIVITDINMPFMNGVDLILKSKEINPDIVLIVLSGYSDFEYVKESLCAGAMDYVLKPVDRIQFVKILVKALEKINERRVQEKCRGTEREKLLRAAAALNDREYSELITKERNRMNCFIQEGVLTQEDAEKGYFLLLLRINKLSELAGIFQYDINLLSYTIKKQIKDKIKDNIILIFNNVYSSSEFIVAIKSNIESVEELGYKMLIQMKEFTGHVVTVGISECHYSEKEIRIAYEEAKEAVNTRKFCSSGKVILHEDSKRMKPRIEWLNGERKIQMLHIMRAEPEYLKKYLDNEIGLTNPEDNRWLVNEIKRDVQNIIRLIARYAHEQNMTYDMIEVDNVIGAALYAIEDDDMEDLKNILNDFIDSVLNIGGEVGFGGSGKETVRAIEKYIESHYFENLSLAMLSNDFHIDSCYLSKLFKKETGKNITTYITEIRIDKSKELMLRDKEKSLTEVAFMVGYDDYNYYNKVFKKSENISPREYRTKNSSKKLENET